MTLFVPAFFPCTVQKMKALVPLVEKWCSQVTIDELKQYLNEQAMFEHERFQSSAAEYLRLWQKVSEIREVVEYQRHPSGVPLTTQEIKDMKKLLRAIPVIIVLLQKESDWLVFQRIH